MTTTKTNPATATQFILELQIDVDGNVKRTVSKTEQESTLKGSLLSRLYPAIRVARVSVPDELTPYEQAVVENTMSTLIYEGVKYNLIGASGAAKEGRFYFVDAAHSDVIAQRFQHWPEAAIVYFSILMTDCKVTIEEPFARVLVVKDHVLGTNDCRGWIRESLYKKLGLAPDRFVQFRLAFDAREPKQAKGAFKCMSDRVADRLAVDIVLPESSIKPSLKVAGRLIPGIGVTGHLFHGPIILGTKAVSRVSKMGSSYTLLEHASKESLETEIVPAAIEQISGLKSAWTNGNYKGLFEFLGKRYVDPADSFAEEADQASIDGNNAEDQLTPAALYSTEEAEWDPTDAALLSDGSGMAIHIPYVSNLLNRQLARRAYRILTSGGFTLPSFALADDGILIEHQGKVLAASDWIPLNAAITSLTAEKSLTVRYPIRMKEDLLPVRHLSDEELTAALLPALGVSSLHEAVIAYILNRQLRLEGTYTLHSETAAQNGGDFDFDSICAIPSDRFPKFVESRIGYVSQYKKNKDKKEKARSQWWNMQLVAMKARGNQIGSITDLKTSCLAAGRVDLAYQLVAQLQNALDSLKHKVQVDEKVVTAIREEVLTAPWLRYKRARTVSDLPENFEVADTDIVGQFYNLLRPVLGDLLAEPRPIQEFRGLFQGETVTKEMFDECMLLTSFYGSCAATVIRRNEDMKAALCSAEDHWSQVRKGDNREEKKVAVLARNHARVALKSDDDRFKREQSFLCRLLQRWAYGKIENRAAWAQAMASVVTNGKGSGGVLFHTFPQEFCDLLAKNTGGRTVKVRMPILSEGHIEVEGRKLISVVQYENADGSIGAHKAVIVEISRTMDLDFSQSVLHK